MGSFDGAGVYELGGLYLLHIFLSILIGRENVVMYRDNTLAGINSSSGLDKLRKNIALFKDETVNNHQN